MTAQGIRSSIYAILVVSIFFLLDLGKSMGAGLMDNIQHSGITPAKLIVAGLVLIIFWMYKGDI